MEKMFIYSNSINVHRKKNGYVFLLFHSYKGNKLSKVIRESILIILSAVEKEENTYLTISGLSELGCIN